ncbi:MAG: hypothetical protein WBC04_19075 [Candidatus Acidiferrales bacterium]
MGFASAFVVVQVDAALRAKAPAIAAAYHLHWQREIDLLGQDVSEEQAVAFEKPYLGVIHVQMNFVLAGKRSRGTVEEVEVLADLFNDRVETTRTHKLKPRMQGPVDADLPIDQLRRCAHFQGLHLPEFTGVKIERAGDIALPNARLMKGEFVYINKHKAFPRVLK